MSTTAFAPEINTMKQPVYQNPIMPMERSTRQIVREELKRQKDLEALEAKHDAGEISDFEYRTTKILLNLMPVDLNPMPDGLCMNCVA